MSLLNRGTLQQRIIALVLLVVMATLLLVGWASYKVVHQTMRQDLGTRALEIARFVSDMDKVKRALKSEHPSASLQPLANKWLKHTSASFIVILSMDGIRYSHPRADLIGKHFTGGDEGPALHGKEYVSEAVGISGPSIRGFSPVYDDNGQQIGAVVVGMFQDNIDAVLQKTELAIFRAFILGLVIGIPGAVFLARNVKKTMYGMEPKDIATLLKQREAILNCVKEGILFTDEHDTIALANDSARTMLKLPQDIIGRNVNDVIPSSKMPQVRINGIAEYNQQQKVNDVVILTNRKPVSVQDKVTGVVATFSEKGEVQRLAEELTGVRRYVEGLRAKTHEFMNKLQAVSGLLELEEYEEAKQFIARAAGRQQEILSFLTQRINDPATIGLLLGKIGQAQELGISLEISPDSTLRQLPETFPSEAMVLIIGNLLENSFEAINDNFTPGIGIVNLTILDKPNQLEITVLDNGPGIDITTKEKCTEKGVSTKEGDRGYGLFLVKRQVVELSNGEFIIDNRPGLGGTMAKVVIPKEGVDQDV